MDDRHYICEHCGLKWFVPASREVAEEELRCGECGTVLTARPEPQLAGELPLADPPVPA